MIQMLKHLNTESLVGRTSPNQNFVVIPENYVTILAKWKTTETRTLEKMDQRIPSSFNYNHEQNI